MKYRLIVYPYFDGAGYYGYSVSIWQGETISRKAIRKEIDVSDGILDRVVPSDETGCKELAKELIEKYNCSRVFLDAYEYDFSRPMQVGSWYGEDKRPKFRFKMELGDIGLGNLNEGLKNRECEVHAKTEEEAKEKALKYFKEYYKCTLESHTRYVISTYLGAKTLEGIGKYKLERG